MDCRGTGESEFSKEKQSGEEAGLKLDLAPHRRRRNVLCSGAGRQKGRVGTAAPLCLVLDSGVRKKQFPIELVFTASWASLFYSSFPGWGASHSRLPSSFWISASASGCGVGPGLASEPRIWSSAVSAAPPQFQALHNFKVIVMGVVSLRARGGDVKPCPL